MRIVLKHFIQNTSSIKVKVDSNKMIKLDPNAIVGVWFGDTLLKRLVYRKDFYLIKISATLIYKKKKVGVYNYKYLIRLGTQLGNLVLYSEEIFNRHNKGDDIEIPCVINSKGVIVAFIKILEF